MTRMPEIQLQGSPLNTTWSPSYYPWKNGYEGFEYRDDLSWTKGRHQFKFGFAWLHDYKNQELQYNTNGVVQFNSSAFSEDSYINFMLGDASYYDQLEYLAGKHWVNNNYGFYVNDNWHVTPQLTLNLGVRYDGMPHAFERYDKFCKLRGRGLRHIAGQSRSRRMVPLTPTRSRRSLLPAASCSI